MQGSFELPYVIVIISFIAFIADYVGSLYRIVNRS
jgi:hypothetical protein